MCVYCPIWIREPEMEAVQESCQQTMVSTLRVKSDPSQEKAPFRSIEGFFAMNRAKEHSTLGITTLATLVMCQRLSADIGCIIHTMVKEGKL